MLSVGDGAFGKKSAEKMQRVITGGAATVLVSHNMDQIRKCCNKVLWIDRGIQMAFGEDVEAIVSAYENFLEAKSRSFKSTTNEQNLPNM